MTVLFIYSPLVCGTASGLATSPNSAFSGSGPSRLRAWNSAAFVGTYHDCTQPASPKRMRTRAVVARMVPGTRSGLRGGPLT